MKAETSKQTLKRGSLPRRVLLRPSGVAGYLHWMRHFSLDGKTVLCGKKAKWVDGDMTELVAYEYGYLCPKCKQQNEKDKPEAQKPYEQNTERSHGDNSKA